MDPRIDESEARRLLRAASETIKVSPAASRPQPARRRVWPVLATAALVAGIVGVGMAWQPGPGDRETPVATPGVSDTATLPKGSVPVVTGLRQEDAKAQLSAAGFEVAISSGHSCSIPAGRVIETEPAVGTTPAGNTVNVVVSDGPLETGSCAMTTVEDDWRLVDLGSGRAAEVGFADEISVVIDGGTAQTMTRKEASDPATWTKGSALALLAASSHVLHPATSPDGGWEQPTFSVRFGLPPASECGVDNPGLSGELEARSLWFGLPGEACPTMLTVLRSPKVGEIVALIARTSRPDGEVADLEVPDVHGRTRGDAQELLIEAGFAVSSHEWERCRPATGVTEQQPQGRRTAPSGSTVSITIEREPRGVDCADLDGAADDLLDWAHSGTTPQLSDRVTLMLGHEQVTVLSGTARRDPEQWSVCDPAGSDTCGNALTTLATYGGEVERDDYADNVPILPDGTPQPDCTADLGGFPRGFAGWHVTLRPPVSVPCGQQWSIDVFVDEAGRINGVNLAPNAPR